MRTIESMCFEITNMATQTEPIHATISSYVNILSSDEIYFALEGVTIQELMEIINEHQTQLMLKYLILHRFKMGPEKIFLYTSHPFGKMNKIFVHHPMPFSTNIQTHLKMRK